MSADTFGPGPKRRFEHPDQNIAFAEFPAVAGRTRYASRCEAADADLIRVPETPHGFLHFGGPAARGARKAIRTWLNARL